MKPPPPNKYVKKEKLKYVSLVKNCIDKVSPLSTQGMHLHERIKRAVLKVSTLFVMCGAVT